MTKREETYCDVCGKQMSQTRDNETYIFGITLRVLDRGMNTISHGSLGLQVHYRSALGVHSSFAKFMNKKDFCSVPCMTSTIQEWVAEAKDGTPERFQENMK